jgi:hypothetical protein
VYVRVSAAELACLHTSAQCACVAVPFASALATHVINTCGNSTKPTRHPSPLDAETLRPTCVVPSFFGSAGDLLRDSRLRGGGERLSARGVVGVDDVMYLSAYSAGPRPAGDSVDFGAQEA